MSLAQEGERRNNSAQLTEFAVNLIGNSLKPKSWIEPKIPIVYAELQTTLKLGTVQTSNSLITMFIYRTELKTHPNLPKHSEIQISNSSTGFFSNTR